MARLCLDSDFQDGSRWQFCEGVTAIVVNSLSAVCVCHGAATSILRVCRGVVELRHGRNGTRSTGQA